MKHWSSVQFCKQQWEITLPYAAEMEANNALKLPIVEEEMVWPSGKRETWSIMQIWETNSDIIHWEINIKNLHGSSLGEGISISLRIVAIYFTFCYFHYLQFYHVNKSHIYCILLPYFSALRIKNTPHLKP